MGNGHGTVMAMEQKRKTYCTVNLLTMMTFTVCHGLFMTHVNEPVKCKNFEKCKFENI